MFNHISCNLHVITCLSTYFDVLGNIFSGTAGPLLPDNIAFQPLNKMWRSPSSEKLSLNMSREPTPALRDDKYKSLSRNGSLSDVLVAIAGPKTSRKLSHHEPLVSLPVEFYKEK